MNVPHPTRADFEKAYETLPPWEIGRPQAIFLSVLDQIQVPVLDAGCGTGELALCLAGRGQEVTAIDYLERPIRSAGKKSAERSVAVEFLVHDALSLEKLGTTFQSAVDSGLFHVFSDQDRSAYVAGLAAVIRPGGRLFLLCFSDREPGTDGPRRITRQELIESFADEWDIESIAATQFETRSDFTAFEFSPGGPHAWFAIIKRKPESSPRAAADQ